MPLILQENKNGLRQETTKTIVSETSKTDERYFLIKYNHNYVRQITYSEKR